MRTAMVLPMAASAAGCADRVLTLAAHVNEKRSLCDAAPGAGPQAGDVVTVANVAAQ